MKTIGRKLIFIAAVCGACAMIGVAGAQIYLHEVLLNDLKSNGTKINYFKQYSTPVFWNFLRGAKVNAATNSLDIGGNSAIQNADGGYVVGPITMLVPSPTPVPSPCPARSLLETWAGNADAGTSDRTVQCCQKTSDGGVTTLAWRTGTCQ